MLGQPVGSLSPDDLSRLREALGTDPATDPRLLFWACLRARVEHWAGAKPEDTAARADAWLVRHGVVDPQLKGIMQMKDGHWPLGRVKFRVPGRARPREVAVDEANMFLLDSFPQIRTQPIVLALLEKLWDVGVSHLPDGPHGNETDDTVRKRARERLARAARMLELNGPGAVRAETLERLRTPWRRRAEP